MGDEERKPLNFLEKTLLAGVTLLCVATGISAMINPLDIKKVSEPAEYAAGLSLILMGSRFYKNYLKTPKSSN